MIVIACKFYRFKWNRHRVPGSICPWTMTTTVHQGKCKTSSSCFEFPRNKNTLIHFICMQSKDSSIVHIIDSPIETRSRSKRCIDQQQLHHRQFGITQNIGNEYVGRINTLSRPHDIQRSTAPENDTRHIRIVSDLLFADNNNQNRSFHS